MPSTHRHSGQGSGARHLLVGLLAGLVPLGVGATGCGERPEGADRSSSAYDLRLRGEPPLPPGSSVVTAESDAFVRSGDEAGMNFGAADTLEVEAEDADETSESLLRFRVGAVAPFDRAWLRLYVIKKSKDPASVVSFAAATWDELSVTWASRPVSGAVALATIPELPTKGWIELDVTAAVKPTRAVTFAVRGTSKDRLAFLAREVPGAAPVLVLRHTAAPPDAGAPAPLPTVSYGRDVQPIWDARCNGCHGAAAPAGGLSLVAPGSRVALVNVATVCSPTLARVKPGDPAGSSLWLKLADDPTKCLKVMPPAAVGGLKALAPAEFAKVETWILEGALDN